MSTQHIYGNIDLHLGEMREVCVEQLQALPPSPEKVGHFVQVGKDIFYGATDVDWVKLAVSGSTVVSEVVFFDPGFWNNNGPNEWVAKFPLSVIKEIYSVAVVNRSAQNGGNPNQVDDFVEVYEPGMLVLFANGINPPVDKYEIRLLGIN